MKPITITDICNRYDCDRHLGGKIMRQIPHFKVGKEWRAHQADLEAWEREQMIYPMPKGVRQPKQPIPFVIPRKKAQ